MPLSIGKVRVDVSLCGSIPRSHLSTMLEQDNRGARWAKRSSQLVELTSSDLNSLKLLSIGEGSCSAVADRTTSTSRAVHSTEDSTPNRCKTFDKIHQLPLERSSDEVVPEAAGNTNKSESTMPHATMRAPPRPFLRLAPSPPLIEPPKWAAPAKGQARLEPVCEAFGTHPVVELTTKPYYRVGRSPTSDLQLCHETSSRRHALLFHHPSGACYIVDCGSAHGTFVNGKRVQDSHLSGVIVPHRVRRGALIRFGGVGAPAFVLKSFSSGMSTKVLTPDATVDSPGRSSGSSLVLLNTRLNALGESDAVEPLPEARCTSGILKKRSFDDIETFSHKRQRCTSPPLASVEEVRIVSPDIVSGREAAPLIPRLSSKRRVTFNDVPQAFYPALVTPDELTEDEASVDSHN